ncbi:UDP-3-O-acyl-N-acetylglucosamine deacetylase [Nitrosophilus kaiyonis]|uniref:UDP-3-O-acyl-N-acetylglucosamine deacetylase n=1 Tax=Nitrosophilus kaiyonis TaxID=2930200 RepID=UPI00248F777D|nr:UDP-3-O-acyl-N-acetylglucosamine deacetylase [Nitrosophilus kaiyonis]
MKQTTISKKVELTGIGLHKGKPVKLILEPLEDDMGIIFYRKDLGVSIPLNPNFVVNTKMATVLGKDDATISTIEHLMSAVFSYGIDNLRITIDADEIPIMDGSSISFCMLLDEAGIKKLSKNKKFMKIKKEVTVKDGDKYVKLKPSNSLKFNFEIFFDHPVIKNQKFSFDFTKKGFIKDIAKARTFGFLHEVQYLRSIGLALGGSLDNAIVLDDRKILNSEGLRFNDEFVRHKILDAIGDMSLLGYAFMGEYESYAGSHHLNHLLTLELLKDKDNYEVIEVKTKEQEVYAFEKAFA